MREVRRLGGDLRVIRGDMRSGVTGTGGDRQRIQRHVPATHAQSRQSKLLRGVGITSHVVATDVEAQTSPLQPLIRQSASVRHVSGLAPS